MATLVSYDLKGIKESFANWVSNLSPVDTPFVSMTGKEGITNKWFQWQTDRLAKVDAANAQVEGSAAGAAAGFATELKENYTQILRKVVEVSDTAKALASYGRSNELAYQMEKAGKEIKRDLEAVLLSSTAAVQGSSTVARKTAGYKALIAARDAADTDANGNGTGAVVNKKSAVTPAVGAVPTEQELWELTYNLYLAGSDANTIMFHPGQAKFFSGLAEKTTNGNRQRVFDGSVSDKLNLYVSTVVDPLGQEYKLIPNRFMEPGDIFFFNPSNWTQMVLRAPTRTQLAKDGSSEKWMLEMEVGLRHRNPFASGYLEVPQK